MSSAPPTETCPCRDPADCLYGGAPCKEGEIRKAAMLKQSPSTPGTTCIEHAYGSTFRLSFQIKVF